MTIIYVLDTETTTTCFKDPDYDYGPNGHIVEFGMVKLDTELRTFGTPIHYTFRDPDATGDEWVYRNTDLELNPAMSDNIRFVDGLLAASFCDEYVTAFNLDAFDKKMIERDMPKFHAAVRWMPDMIYAADKIDGIPRKIHDLSTGFRSLPSVQSTWDYLFPDEPMQEAHRAPSDALQEAKILLKLVDMGLYPYLEGIR